MSTPLRPNRIENEYKFKTVAKFVEEFDDKKIDIPEHQREYCWDLPRQKKFIESILSGYPIPSFLMSERRADPKPTLEDGRQRLTTVSRFFRNLFSVEWPPSSGSHLNYSDLKEDDRNQINKTNICIISFSKAKDDDRIKIFNRFNSGIVLSPGEHYHAQHASPLVSFVKELLMTPGSGYHDRAAAIWDVRGDPLVVPENFVSKDKRRKWLLGATALVLGLVYGPANGTKKYEPDRGLITAEIPPAKKTAVKKDLERILEIYEAVEARVPATKPKKWKNAHWDMGTYTGYILYSLSALAREGHNDSQADLPKEEKVDFEDGFYEPNSLKDDPAEWATIKATWVDYMCSVRRTINANPTKKLKTVLEEKIHKGISKARSWTNARWEDGYKRVFGIPITDTASVSGDDDEEDSDEESDE